MPDATASTNRWGEYRPSKTLWFWSLVGAVVVTMIVGFTWGGWVRGSTAHEMAENAAADFRHDLAAAICVDRFMAAPDAQAQLADLKKESSWSRSGVIAKGDWARMPDTKEASRDVTSLCAERLADLEPAIEQNTAAAQPADVSP